MLLNSWSQSFPLCKLVQRAIRKADLLLPSTTSTRIWCRVQLLIYLDSHPLQALGISSYLTTMVAWLGPILLILFTLILFHFIFLARVIFSFGESLRMKTFAIFVIINSRLLQDSEAWCSSLSMSNGVLSIWGQLKDLTPESENPTSVKSLSFCLSSCHHLILKTTNHCWVFSLTSLCQMVVW